MYVHSPTSDTSAERARAWRHIDEILKKHRRAWIELPELINNIPDDNPQPAAPANDYRCNLGPLDLIEGMLRRYVQLNDHEYVAAALWIAHTYIYDRFAITPRQALTAPTSDCGKTTLMLMLEALCASPHKCDDITPAALFRLIESGVTTLLLDEIDNADLAKNRTFRTIANGGHRRGGRIVRTIDGRARSFDTFAPMALGAINGMSLPLPLRRRSISIHLERASSDLTRFDEILDKAALDITHQSVYFWANEAKLAPDPAMPRELRGRAADNWRVLFALADAYGEGWGERRAWPR